jgi:hypothetical protein
MRSNTNAIPGCRWAQPRDVQAFRVRTAPSLPVAARRKKISLILRHFHLGAEIARNSHLEDLRLAVPDSPPL